MKDFKKSDKVIIINVFENKLEIYNGMIKTKGKKIITIEINYPWFNESERHYLNKMTSKRYTTKIYDLNVDINKVKEDLEKEFNTKFIIEDMRNKE